MTGFKRAIAGGAAGLLYGVMLVIISIGGAILDDLAYRRCHVEEFDSRGRGIWRCELSRDDLEGFRDRSNVDLLTLSSAPFGLLSFLGPPLMWATIGSLVALSGRGKSLRLAQALVALHYVSGLALLATTGTGPRGLAGKVPDYFFVWATFYLAGQVVLWRQMIRRSGPKKGMNGRPA
jgi:hypothetical protein